MSDRESGFGGPTWNDKLKDWNACFRYDSLRGRVFCKKGNSSEVPGNEAGRALFSVRQEIGVFANAVCRIVANTSNMSRFFITPHHCVTGLHFKYHGKKCEDIKIRYTFEDYADGM